VVAYPTISKFLHIIQKACRLLTQVEVVLHAVAEDKDTTNGVDKGCSKLAPEPSQFPDSCYLRTPEAFLPLK
jgi:hypothetical protein